MSKKQYRNKRKEEQKKKAKHTGKNVCEKCGKVMPDYFNPKYFGTYVVTGYCPQCRSYTEDKSTYEHIPTHLDYLPREERDIETKRKILENDRNNLKLLLMKAHIRSLEKQIREKFK